MLSLGTALQCCVRISPTMLTACTLYIIMLIIIIISGLQSYMMKLMFLLKVTRPFYVHVVLQFSHGAGLQSQVLRRDSSAASSGIFSKQSSYQSSMDRGSFESAADESGEPSPSLQLDKHKTT